MANLVESSSVLEGASVSTCRCGWKGLPLACHHPFLSEGPGSPDVHFSPKPVPQPRVFPHLPQPGLWQAPGCVPWTSKMGFRGCYWALGSGGALGLFASAKPQSPARPGSGLAQTPCPGLGAGPGSMAVVPPRTRPSPVVGHGYTGASGSWGQGHSGDCRGPHGHCNDAATLRLRGLLLADP